MDTILVDDIYRFYEREDLLQCLEREVGHLKVLEAWVRSGDMNRIFPPVEGAYFWLGSEKKMTLHTVFVAYMERYLINPKCCEDNDSKIICYIPEKSSRKGAEKLHHAHNILDEIVQMDEKNFPQDGDTSIYSRIDHLYKVWHNRCCSCGGSVRRGGMHVLFEIQIYTGRTDPHSAMGKHGLPRDIPFAQQNLHARRCRALQTYSCFPRHNPQQRYTGQIIARWKKVLWPGFCCAKT